MLDIALSETPVRSHRMTHTAPLRASFLSRTAQASRRFFLSPDKNTSIALKAKKVGC